MRHAIFEPFSRRVLLDFAPVATLDPRPQQGVEGVWLPWHPFQTPLFTALSSALERAGFAVSIGQNQGLDVLQRVVASGRFHGVVSTRPARDEGQVALLTGIFGSIPTVTCAHGFSGGRVNHVGLDDGRAVQGLMNLLRMGGHKRPAFVAQRIPRGTLDNAVKRRYEAFRNDQRDRGQPWGAAQTLWWDDPRGFWKGNTVARFLEGPGRSCDALVCANDQVAFRILDVLRQMGRTVPDDIAVTGIDGVHKYQGPEKLATMAQDIKALAGSVVYLLEGILSGIRPSPGQRIEVPPRLIRGNTVRPRHTGLDRGDMVCRDMETYLRLHMDDPDPLSGLAEILGVGRIQVLRTWRKNRDERLGTWLNREKLRRAGELLHASSADVEDIAHQCGFTSRRTFHRLFLEQFGATPAAWRSRR